MKRILVALLVAAALVAGAAAIWRALLEGQCDPEFTPEECAKLR